MSENTAPQKPVLAVGETRNFAVSFANVLDAGETLTGTPTVTEETTTDLTISSKTVSITALTINGQSVAIGKAVQFKVSGQLAATGSYTIKIVVGSSSTPSQTFVKWVKFFVDDQ